MAFLIGAVLAIVIGLSATLFGLDRDRAFYPTVMIVIASYYVLFAVVGGSMNALIIELIVAAVFLGASIAGFKYTLWLIVAALLAHGIFDFVHGRFIANPGVPAWWPAFCLTYDVAAAAYLGWLLTRKRVRADAIPGSASKRIANFK
ncbi:MULTISPECIES: hypothetical protein [unclassified Methylocaldum]|jgi:hypothetical protein|uniref:hypothetical protein n=2 Tax=Methylocaldum TaxID=73778 RepID=UPI00098B9339|nr:MULTISPECIES: hypothetical protein [unclassified Methylocaldum]MBP1150295.1 hypothetical protein [Methylocaldum sp. RMAD-M]MDV3242315.1 hypothetical protein [Methylocaldum sp.]